jgi:hypothetical protein
MVTSIAYDKANSDQTERASMCEAELTSELERVGIRCYRRPVV